MITRGFSLLETLVYMGLFGVFMQGTLAGIFAISESAERNQAKAYLEVEGEFITKKISYEISQATQATLQNPESGNSQLSLTEPGNVSEIIGLSNASFFISRGASPASDFSSNGVRVSNVRFSSETKVGIVPSPVSFSFTLQTEASNGRVFTEDFSGETYPDL